MNNDAIKVTCNRKEINDKLLELADSVKNSKKILRKIGHTIKNYADEKFETEGSYQGEKWEEWKPSTKKKRIKMKRGKGKILSLSGELRESLDDKITADSVEVGTNKKYAAIHNFGGDVKKRSGGTFPMPKRTYLSWEDKLCELITDEVYAELKLHEYVDKYNA